MSRRPNPPYLPPIPRTPVYVDEAADRRARQLGLSGVGVLRDATAAGASAARTVTSSHPRSYRGTRDWAESLAFLRDRLGAPWEPEFHKGVDTVVNRRLGIAIIVTMGDGGTGRQDYAPQVHYSRGDVIRHLVNGAMDTLFGATEERPDWTVWFLLHHLGREQAQAELSRPTAISSSGWVELWGERLLVPDNPFGPNGSTPVRPPKTVDVNVERRVV